MNFIYCFFRRVCSIRIYNIYCDMMHTKEENIFFKKVQKHGGMFTWKFKMAAICIVKLYMSLPIHRCIDLSNPLRIYRDSIFLKLFVIPGGNALPKKSNRGIFLPPFQIGVGGAKEHPPPLG